MAVERGFRLTGRDIGRCIGVNRRLAVQCLQSAKLAVQETYEMLLTARIGFLSRQ